MYKGIKQKEAEAGKFRNKIQAVKQLTAKQLSVEQCTWQTTHHS